MTILSTTTTALSALTIGATLLVPGPTNTLLFLAGTKHGIKRSLVLVGAELTGYCLAIGTWWTFISLANAIAPTALTVARGCSATYVGWLAIKTWREAGDGNTIEDFRAHALFCASLLNPKAFFIAAIAFPPASAGGKALLQAYLLFSALAIPIGVGWICMGAITVPGVSDRRQLLVHRTVALVLLIFSASIWVSVLS